MAVSTTSTSLWWNVLATLALMKVPSSSGLSNLRVSIPETIPRGADVAFNCSFNLQDEQLYAIKWYRGTYEIFRFVPSQDPMTKMFPLEGFNISKQYSTGRTLYMFGVDFVNSGAYSCEVIADTTFHTLIETKEMLVIDLPDDKPRITGVNENGYKIGDSIQATCTSWQSNPPANLTWFINGEPAREEYLRHYDLRREFDDTFTTVLGLHFTVQPIHFNGNAMMLKCTSSMLSVYWQSSQVRLLLRSPKVTSEVNMAPASGAGSGGTGRSRHQRKKSLEMSTHRRKNGSGGEHAKDGAKPTSNSNKKPADKMPVEQLTSHVLSCSSSIYDSAVIILVCVVAAAFL